MSDLSVLLESPLHATAAISVDQRAQVYGVQALRIVETERDIAAKAEKDKYQKLLVEGPTLLLPNAGKFGYGFDPNDLVPLAELGTVYPTMQVSDAWGTLDVQQGALLSQDFKSVTIAAPTKSAEPHLEGPGWKLDLADGWHLVPASKSGNYTLQKR